MPYIGKSPVGGGFHKLDNLTASATDTYALTLGSAAYYPETANQLLVSLNGVIQAPQDSFTVSGSNLVFDSALTASDSIDFVVALGDVLGVGTPTDGTVTTAKIANNAVTSAKLDSNIDIAGTLDVTGALTADSGIKLGAGTDVLSIYDEGAWTPSIGGTATYNVQTGYYTRVGNLVLCIYDIHINVIGTGSASIMTGFPFTAANLTSGPISYYAGIATSVYSLDSYIINGSTNMYFTGHTTASVNIGNNLNVFQNGARIVGAVTYRV